VPTSILLRADEVIERARLPVLGTFETCADDVCRSAYGARADLSRISMEGRLKKISRVHRDGSNFAC
jgi:hypothetical protein